MTVMMMNVIPANIEASMFAFITAILTFSTDWGGNFVGGIVCKIFNIENQNMKNFGDALILKNFSLLFAIILTQIIPTNKEIKDLGYKLNEIESENNDS